MFEAVVGFSVYSVTSGKFRSREKEKIDLRIAVFSA